MKLKKKNNWNYVTIDPETGNIVPIEDSLLFVCSNCQDKWHLKDLHEKAIEKFEVDGISIISKELVCKNCGNNNFEISI